MSHELAAHQTVTAAESSIAPLKIKRVDAIPVVLPLRKAVVMATDAGREALLGTLEYQQH